MKPSISEDTRVAEIVTHYPQTRRLLEEVGIDYCCGGRQPLRDACRKAGLSQGDVVARLGEVIRRSKQEQARPVNWLEAPLTGLVGHIIDAHHGYLKENLPRLKGLSDKVYEAHRQRHGDMVERVKRCLEQLRIDIEMHLAKEEQILFPLIRQMEVFVAGQGLQPVIHCGTIENPIRQMEAEHESAGGILAEIRGITRQYEVPEDGCESFRALYDGLAALEANLHEHIHLENNILFPRAVELESKVGW